LLTDTDEPLFSTGHDLLRLADALASVVHAGQVRKGQGEPYYNHVSRVAGRVDGWRAKTIAYLHDVIEDTPVTAEGLIDMGFPPTLVLDVVSLSRSGGETYSDFISRTIERGSLDALRVKLSDLQDNLTDPWASETKLATRYLPAVRRITEEIERRKTA
jgi:hypothetical protein